MIKVLILTLRDDPHARIVAECLRRKGAFPILWYPDEFLINHRIAHTVSAEKGHNILLKMQDNSEIGLNNIDVVWYRRVKRSITIPQQLNFADQKFVENENRMHMLSLWLTLGPAARWVNPFQSFEKANSKILQLKEAFNAGLNVPETLITNDKAAVVDFINHNQPLSTIYKSFTPATWKENNKTFSCYTTRITTEMLADEASMALTPGIFQKEIKKEYEIRITFFGDEYVAVKIDNKSTLDWRKLNNTPYLKLSQIKIPSQIEKSCQQIMKNLGIVFGCFDFIVTPADEFVFLEVNEMGQFLWIEERLPKLKLLDKFCNFLLSTRKADSAFTTNNSFSLKEISTLIYT